MNLVDTIIRILIIGLLIAYAAFRLVRYFRYGMARRVTAVPPAAGILMPQSTAPVPAALEPTQSRRPGVMTALRTLAVWLGGNLILAAVLFALPALASVPLIWRLFAQIFANFYLLPFARRAAEGRKAELPPP